MKHRIIRALGTTAVAAALVVAPVACASAPSAGPAAAPPTATGSGAEAAAVQGGTPGPPDAAAQIAGMERLAFMVGRWEGSGYAVRQGGVRSDFTQTEVVEYKLDGALIAIDGDGRDAVDPARAVHSAFAVATYDPDARIFRWEAFSDGSRLETELVVTESGWQWMFQPAPQVTVRYTAEFTADEWSELGEISLDGGATWTTNLEMTLARVG